MQMQDSHSRFPTISKILVVRQFLYGASFFGTYVLLTKFFLNHLNYSEEHTIMMLGAFGSVSPVFASIGGYVADRFIGSFRATYIGYTIYCTAFFCMGFSALTLRPELAILAMALNGYGRGLSATSPSVLFGNSYAPDNNEAFQQGLTINYSINNLGSFSSKYIFPFLLVFIGYQGDFFIAGGLMLLCLGIFAYFNKALKSVGNEVDRRPVPLKVWGFFIVGSLACLGLVFWIFSHLEAGKWLIYALGVGVIGYFIYEIFKASPEFRYKMSAVLIMTFVLICFYFYYGQMYTSMNMYAIKVATNHVLGFIPIHQESSLAFNPLWVFVLGGPMIYVYDKLAKWGFSPTIPTKIGIAFFFTAAAFLLLGLSTHFVDANGQVSMDWILWVHFFQSIAELVVGALSTGFVFEMLPKRLKAFGLGLTSVALSFSGILAAVLATHIALPKTEVLTEKVVSTVYGGYFYQLGFFALIMAVIALIIARFINKLIEKGEKLHAENLAKEAAL